MGLSQWFVGYKKHTLRLWLCQHHSAVLLVPVVSWAVPAHRDDGIFLRPSLDYCARHLDWLPDLVVGDKGYISMEVQGDVRQRLGVGVVTPLRSGMKLIPPFEPGLGATCPQGQPLSWLGLEGRDQRHWFGVTEEQPLCPWCWQQGQCERQFSYAASEHEMLLGQIPLASAVARRLLAKVRPWIEPAQAFEKNQLGLAGMFLNSLRLTWTACLLADAIVLLRARALLTQAPTPLPLHQLMPKQLSLDWKE